MVIFALLLGLFALFSLAPLSRAACFRTPRARGAIAMALMFLFTGSYHFFASERFAQFVPPFLPFPMALVYISGALEIAGGLGLLIPRTRRWAAWGLVLFLIAVWPGNLHVALNHVPLTGIMGHPVYQWIRVPFQLVFIGWAIWCAKEEKRVN